MERSYDDMNPSDVGSQFSPPHSAAGSPEVSAFCIVVICVCLKLLTMTYFCIDYSSLYLIAACTLKRNCSQKNYLIRLTLKQIN